MFTVQPKVLKDLFGDMDVLFVSKDKYFKINFSELEDKDFIDIIFQEKDASTFLTELQKFYRIFNEPVIANFETYLIRQLGSGYSGKLSCPSVINLVRQGYLKKEILDTQEFVSWENKRKKFVDFLFMKADEQLKDKKEEQQPS